MPDFLIELLSEEIPARMQAKAQQDLARLFSEQLSSAGLAAEAVETYATPRRLALIARGLPAETEAVGEETKGPRASAPPQALEGFLRKTGLGRDQLEERDGILFAIVDRPGRATSAVLAEAVPAIVRAFPWPKSMRWGAASASTESPRWVRPLQGIVALLGDNIVDFEIAGVRSGAATVGHRFHHAGPITIGSANDYKEKLRACHVLVDPAERRRIVAEGAAAAARAAGLALVEDEALVAENAGLTEWPVPLLGRFDPAFLDVPAEVIQLTMRTNQKYFACVKSSPSSLGEGDHAQHGGGAERSEEAAPPLRSGPSTASGGPPPRGKLGEELAPNFVCVANIEAADGGAAIVAGNERVLSARLSDARFFWEQDLKIPLEEQAAKLSQIVFHEKLGTVADKVERVAKLARWLIEEGIVKPPPGESAEELASFAETAAHLAKADLVTGLVGEFPELQGVIGGHLALCQGHARSISDAIRDHYKPVGQGDEVPTAPVTVAVSLADKLDSLVGFFQFGEKPTGSKDPFALRRAALGILSLIIDNNVRVSMFDLITAAAHAGGSSDAGRELAAFLIERLKVQQREAGIRHDMIDAVVAVEAGGDNVRMVRRVRALQAFVETAEGADLLAGYKRAANILKKEGWAGLDPAGTPHVPGSDPAGAPQAHGSDSTASPQAPGTIPVAEPYGNNLLSYTPEKEEAELIAALDSAEPRARTAVEAEDFEGAMAALASLRAPVDAFFDKVTVNDPDSAKRAARLDLLARMRDAVHQVADFSRIEG